MRIITLGMLLACLLTLCSFLTPKAGAAETYSIAEGAVTLPVPEGWTRKQPATRIVEHEFSISPAEGDENPGRATVMGAGGSIDDNLVRWYGQFSQPDGSSTRDKAKVEKRTVAGQDVVMVDVTGTYRDSPAGPFGGGQTIERENYRMLAAIVSTKKDGKFTGNYFIKFYGPKNTVTKNEQAFQKMIDGIQAK